MVLLLLFVSWDRFSFGWLVGFMFICIEFERGSGCLGWLVCIMLFGWFVGVVMLVFWYLVCSCLLVVAVLVYGFALTVC